MKGIRITRRIHQPITFRADRIASAIGYLTAAIVDLEGADVAPSTRAHLAAERSALVAAFRVEAPRAGWSQTDVKAVTA